MLNIVTLCFHSGHLKWKDQLLKKASEAFLRRQREVVNFQKLVYGTGIGRPFHILMSCVDHLKINERVLFWMVACKYCWIQCCVLSVQMFGSPVQLFVSSVPMLVSSEQNLKCICTCLHYYINLTIECRTSTDSLHWSLRCKTTHSASKIWS